MKWLISAAFVLFLGYWEAQAVGIVREHFDASRRWTAAHPYAPPAPEPPNPFTNWQPRSHLPIPNTHIAAGDREIEPNHWVRDEREDRTCLHQMTEVQYDGSHVIEQRRTGRPDSGCF